MLNVKTQIPLNYMIIYREVVFRVHTLERSGLKFSLCHLLAVIDVKHYLDNLLGKINSK